MSKVGQIERKTQGRVVAVFQHTLGYEFLDGWVDRVSPPSLTNAQSLQR